MEISDSFIDNYFNKANPSFILVYIALRRLSSDSERTVMKTADFLNITEGDVRRALKYFRDAGVIDVSEDEKGLLAIEFLLEKTEKPAEEKARPVAVMASRPVYTSVEIDFYLESNLALRSLFKSCEGLMGKLLSYNDMCVLFSFHDWLRMSFELIELIVEYCCSNGHRSIRYIESVAITWADAGIDTIEKAKERIKLYNKDFRQIMAALGKRDREPTRVEEAFMIKWLKTYKMPLELAIEACERTVLATSKPSFKYADSIIESWYSKGALTREAIESEDAAFKASAASSEKSKSAKPKTRKTAFSNFNERENLDFSEIQRLEMERINKELGL